MYDLHKVFENNVLEIDENVTIIEDPFLYTKEFKNVAAYRQLLNQIITQINEEETLPLSEAHRLIALNPGFWQAYFWAGRIAFSNQNIRKLPRFLKPH